MATSEFDPGTIPEEGTQRPTVRFLNRYVRDSVGLKWHDLGIELLDSKDVDKLDIIEADHPSDHEKCCAKMLKLWLKKQPSASWNQMIEALRQPDIELETLATKIEGMLLQTKPKEQPKPHSMPHSIVVDTQSPLISITSLNADFTRLLINVCDILSNAPDNQVNLKACKKYCALLRITDSSNESLFSAEKISKIKKCRGFKQLFEIISWHMNWDEHSILMQIVDQCNSVEGQQEIEKFEKKLALYQGLQIIATTSQQNLSKDFARFRIIINKPYKSVTVEEYMNIRAYIFGHLETKPYVAYRFIGILYHSLHIDWLVTAQAVPNMIKNAHQNKNVFIQENYIFMQIGIEVVIGNEGLFAQLSSSKQIFYLKEYLVKQEFYMTKITEDDDVASSDRPLTLEHFELSRKTSSKADSFDEQTILHGAGYFKPFTVAGEFAHVTEQVTMLLQSLDPKLLVEQCDMIMASDGIKFFSDDQIQQLNAYSDTPLLLQHLSHLWSWSNHSVLRVLVGFCDEAIKLLDEFDCRLDPFEPITSYPVFEILPNDVDVTTQTVFNVKFTEDTSKVTLQDVFNMCSLVTNKYGISQYCPQLIATQQAEGFIKIYCSIPNCIVNLISSKTLQGSSKLYDMGILEVKIYPDIKIVTGAAFDFKAHDFRIGVLDVECKPILHIGGSSSDQKALQLSSENVILKADLETLNQEYHQLINIHTNSKIKKDKISVAIQTEAIEKQDLSKQLRHVRRQYESVVDENQKLKQDKHNLSESLQKQVNKYKELEEIQSKKQADVEQKRNKKFGSQLKKFRELKVALDKVVKTFDIDAELPFKMDLTDENIVIGTTEVEYMEKMEYEIEDIQKSVKQLQHYATEAKISMEKSIQQKSDLDEVNTKLDMKEKDIAKLKEDNRILLKSRSERKESKQPDAKVDKDSYPIQYELLGKGNYGEVQKVKYKDKSYAGKLFYSKLLPDPANMSMDKLVAQFTLKCFSASKFSHPNVEQFVEIAHADDKGVPMIITELLKENLTAYVSRTTDTFHYDLQLSVCDDMAQGLQYLHSQQFVHLNLHGANVLMTSDHRAKIADYLCPHLLAGVAPDSSSVYLPPETTQDKRITVQSNVFTLSVLFLQVITKLSPQPSNNLNLSALERRKSDLEKVPKSHPLLALIQQCLSDHELKRPLMREIFDHLAQSLKDKDSLQMMAFKLIHTTEYPSFVPSLTSGSCQLKHITCQNLPVPMYWAYAVTIGTKVYVTGGNSRTGDALEHVFRFDLEKNKWDKLLPPSEYHHGVPVVLESKLSLIGGRIPKSKVVIGMVNTYDEEGNQWKTIYPDMKQPRYRPAVVANDSHLIVMGGKIKERSILTDTIEIMNIKTKQWTMVATTLPNKMYDMSATISNNLVWIIGYDDGNKRSNKVITVPLDDLIYLTTTKLSWKPLRNDTICFKTANICYSDPPVILGGDDRQNKTVSAVVVYDPETKFWNEVATLSSPRANCNVVQLPGNRGMLVIGGCSETKSHSHCSSSCLNTTEIYYCNN